MGGESLGVRKVGEGVRVLSQGEKGKMASEVERMWGWSQSFGSKWCGELWRVGQGVGLSGARGLPGVSGGSVHYNFNNGKGRTMETLWCFCC